MKLSFVKNLLLFVCVCVVLSFSNACYAMQNVTLRLGDDYLLTTEQSIKSYNVVDNSVLQVNPFFTIMNEKNVLLIHPLKVGVSEFKVCFDKNFIVFNVLVKTTPVKDVVIENTDYEIMKIDVPEDPTEKK